MRMALGQDAKTIDDDVASFVPVEAADEQDRVPVTAVEPPTLPDGDTGRGIWDHGTCGWRQPIIRSRAVKNFPRRCSDAVGFQNGRPLMLQPLLGSACFQ